MADPGLPNANPKQWQGKQDPRWPQPTVPGSGLPPGWTASTSGGPPGMDGEEGEPGSAGPPGAIGPAGPTGPAGPAGPGGQSLVGPSGADGEPGEDGWPIPGPQGVAGPTGATGPTGAAGPQGASGWDGADGDDAWVTPGPQGIAGPSTGALLAIQRFATHQTVTPTFNASTNTIIIKLLGAGGGARSVAAPVANSVAIGAPGGGGAYLEKLISGRANFVGKQLIVGTGGAGGAAAGAPNNGVAGTATSFDAGGANYSAGGGAAGVSSDVANYGWIVFHFANGGTASNGDLNVSGGSSFNFSVTSATSPSALSQGGPPGEPHYGFPGVANSVLATSAVQGGDGSGNGSGGSGGITYNGNTPLRGGNGTDGYAEIWEFS